jgi:hypothetical protein
MDDSSIAGRTEMLRREIELIQQEERDFILNHPIGKLDPTRATRCHSSAPGSKRAYLGQTE